MEINKVDRKTETIQIIKNEGEIIDFSFREIDILINLLFNFKYIKIENEIRFNHYLPEVRLAESVNGKYSEKVL